MSIPDNCPMKGRVDRGSDESVVTFTLDRDDPHEAMVIDWISHGGAVVVKDGKMDIDKRWIVTQADKDGLFRQYPPYPEDEG